MSSLAVYTEKKLRNAARREGLRGDNKRSGTRRLQLRRTPFLCQNLKNKPELMEDGTFSNR